MKKDYKWDFPLSCYNGREEQEKRLTNTINLINEQAELRAKNDRQYQKRAAEKMREMGPDM